MHTKTFNTDNFLKYILSECTTKELSSGTKIICIPKACKCCEPFCKNCKNGWDPLKDAIILRIILWVMLYSQKITQKLTFAVWIKTISRRIKVSQITELSDGSTHHGIHGFLILWITAHP